MKFECTVAEFIELASANFFPQLETKVNIMTQALQDAISQLETANAELKTANAQFQTALQTEQATSAALVTSNQQIVQRLVEVKDALDQAGVDPTLVTRIAAITSDLQVSKDAAAAAAQSLAAEQTSEAAAVQTNSDTLATTTL